MTDLDAAAQFVAGHARLIERRRFARLFGDGSPELVLRALDAYRNADGGIGLVEPDVRTPASQPSCVLYALEILQEAGIADRSLATGALDWLQTVTQPDGGVPFVLASAKGWPHAPWFAPQDAPGSSLLITAGLAAAAHRLGIEHPWLDGATAYCWQHAADARTADPYTVRFVADFLDAVPDPARASAGLDALAARIPADGLLRVEAGAEGELLRPLEVVAWPGHAARRLYADDVIERELDRLAAEQQDDGGWNFTWLAWNPAAALEWRGIVTVLALRTLQAYGRL
jgi:hypothetical protein